MKFTREVPTEDGWYWVADVRGSRPYATEVYKKDGKQCIVWGSCEWEPTRLPFEFLYGDRIPEPEVEVCDD